MKKTLLYLYQRRYPNIEELLTSLPSTYEYLSLKATPERAFSYKVSKVPALLVTDKRGDVRVTLQGLTSVKNFLENLHETPQKTLQ